MNSRWIYKLWLGVNIKGYRKASIKALLHLLHTYSHIYKNVYNSVRKTN